MKRAAIAFVATFAALTAPGAASAATYIITYKGTVSSGYDQTGEFGAANTDLTGKSFTATYTLTSPLSGAYVFNDGTLGYTNGGLVAGTPSPVSGKIKIGGATVFVAGSNLGQAYQLNGNPIPSGYDKVAHNVSDFFTDFSVYKTTYNYLNAEIYSYNNQIVTSSNYTQSLNYTVQVGDVASGYAQVSLFNARTATYERYAYAALTPDSVTISALGVPEPSTWAMMIAGFGLIGGAMRRRRAFRIAYT